MFLNVRNFSDLLNAGNLEPNQSNQRSGPGSQRRSSPPHPTMTQFPLASPKEPPQGVAASSAIAPSNGPSQPVPESPSCYNSRLFRSIVKGASDFKCKHCGEAFTKLENLTKHMYAKE